jgi:hypothetical protein
MNRDEMQLRFEELDAGRALGDLEAAEVAEWAALAERLGLRADQGLDHCAAEIEATMIGNAVMVPSGLEKRLGLIESLPSPPRVSFGPWMGWALAACLLGLLAIDREGTDPRKSPSASALRDSLIQAGAEMGALRFTGNSGEFSDVNGEVVWSDERQEGYMTLSDIPSNDPTNHQYQLWIIDPSRDEIPVDGGVFNIPPGGGSVVIPIDAKLAVSRPTAFVITREKPGGVVRSAQEVVVAVAKR